MDKSLRREAPRLLDRMLIGGLFLLVLLLIGLQVAHAGEVIPSIGVTRSVDNPNSDAQVFGGLAFRGQIAPMLKSEIGVAYRSQEMNSGDLKVHMWPVTASVWVTPIPTIYAGGGVGWYHTTLEYAPALGLDQSTSQEFGVHLGGGVTVPITPMAAIDLNGRYIFMKDQASELPPNSFDPDFWSTSVGLAFRF
jgi:opacity protein-like surface antigen